MPMTDLLSGRRTWFKQMAAAWGALFWPGAARGQLAGKTILLLSSWQSVNIGDVTHTSGILRLLRQHVPDARVILWPGEAASVYARARALISAECHSPIIALMVGSAAFYVRQPEDTIKGQIYYDLGLSDWVFEVEQTSGAQIAERLMQVHRDHAAAVARGPAPRWARPRSSTRRGWRW